MVASNSGAVARSISPRTATSDCAPSMTMFTLSWLSASGSTARRTVGSRLGVAAPIATLDVEGA